MPAEPKLTRWFKWPTKPVRVGWYDVRWYPRLYWDGRVFATRPPGELRMEFLIRPGDQWRGLAEKPKE